MAHSFELILFSNDVPYVQQATRAGLDGVIIDRENMGKSHRQLTRDTQVNYHTFDDLEQMRSVSDIRTFCRINNLQDIRIAEAKRAIRCGADEIFLPMVRTVAEVTEVLQIIEGKADLGILIETEEGIAIAEDLSHLPLSHVYVGLNDLAIARSMSNIFENVYNGTVEYLRDHFPHIPFGFGGLTIPPHGNPIPTVLLMAEMMRLECNFTFLRRSFLRDVPIDKLGDAIPLIKSSLQTYTNRTVDKIEEHQNMINSYILDIMADS